MPLGGRLNADKRCRSSILPRWRTTTPACENRKRWLQSRSTNLFGIFHRVSGRAAAGAETCFQAFRHLTARGRRDAARPMLCRFAGGQGSASAGPFAEPTGIGSFSSIGGGAKMRPQRHRGVQRQVEDLLPFPVSNTSCKRIARRGGLPTRGGRRSRDRLLGQADTGRDQTELSRRSAGVNGQRRQSVAGSLGR